MGEGGRGVEGGVCVWQVSAGRFWRFAGGSKGTPQIVQKLVIFLAFGLQVVFSVSASC